MHSCKENEQATDMQFYPVHNSIVAFGDGEGRCLKPKSVDVGSLFTTAECDKDDALQSICWMPDGTFRLQSDEMKCLVSADAENADAGPYVKRDLSVALCDTTLDEYKLWMTYGADGSQAETSGPGCVERKIHFEQSGASSLALSLATLALTSLLM